MRPKRAFVPLSFFLSLALFPSPSVWAQADDPAETAAAPTPETALKSQENLAPSVSAMTAVRTAIEMKVLGVLAIGEGDDRRSSAIIAMGKAGGGSRAYSPGQVIAGDPDLRLVRVRNARIEFLNKGRLEFAPVKQFPEAGWGGGGGGSSSSASTSVSDARSAREERLRALRERRMSRGSAGIPVGEDTEEPPQEEPASAPDDQEPEAP